MVEGVVVEGVVVEGVVVEGVVEDVVVEGSAAGRSPVRADRSRSAFWAAAAFSA